MTDPQTKGAARKPRRRLAPSEKYEIYVQVLTQQATQREAAEKWGVDRSTVVHICRTAKQGALDALAASVPGRPGVSAEAAARVTAIASIGPSTSTGRAPAAQASADSTSPYR